VKEVYLVKIPMLKQHSQQFFTYLHQFSKKCSYNKPFIVTAHNNVCKHYFNAPELKQSIAAAKVDSMHSHSFEQLLR